jgi:hypothetical protein
LPEVYGIAAGLDLEKKTNIIKLIVLPAYVPGFNGRIKEKAKLKFRKP